VSVDANTASCPQSVVTSFEISTGAGNDQIDLSGSLVPSLVLGGTGQDQIIGGTEEDTFVWNVHDGSDTIDGGPGSDSLVFNGNHMGETIGIQTDGAGFVLYRDLGNILLQVSGTELLEVWTFEGEDRVFTNALVDTTQRIVDDANDLIPTDTLTVDAQGLCLTRKGDTFNVETRQPIEFVHFTSLVVENNCGVDPSATALATQGCVVNGVPNQLCVGTPGDDKIAGTTGADVIKGGGGRDRIRGGAGADLLCGEAGDDVLIGGQDNDTIVGWSGQDQLKGDAGNDYLLGGPDGDVVSSGTGDDYIDGEKGDDRLRGQAGFDSIQGGPGFDLINGGAAIDVCGDVDQSGPFPSCED
jgi:Ca2+-binding RTX toxin-like protein